MSIIFAAPGLGKSFLVKSNPLYIDCDSVIETATGRKVSELSWTSDWNEAKASVLKWWKQYYPNHTLIVGKDRYIKDADVVYLHESAAEMQQRIASLERENPIFDWDCVEKEAEYVRLAEQHDKNVVRIKYLSDVL